MPGIIALQAGVVFAKDFRVINKLSEGGMGAIYVVEQLSTGRERALKLMHPELVGDANLRAKFVQEARIGARVKSDHVVEVVAAGVDDSTGVPYLAMELLEGEDLAALLARETPSSDQAFAILEQFCHAVAAAHASGIVHRDLKPENVFLRASRNAGGSAIVKVLDFGIAKVVEDARTNNNTGALGSPFWMAPEQTERRANITPATDVWALGLIAFNLFSGKPFWRSANDEASSLTAFMRELVLEPIPPASERAADYGVADRMPPEFDAWFARCVTREPQARFADASVAWSALTSAAGKRSWTLPAAHETPKQASPSRTADMALARTVAHTGDAPEPEDDEPHRVPVASSKWPLIAGAWVVVLVGGGVVMAMRSSTSSVVDPQPSSPADKAASELLCPDGMASIAGGKLAMGSNDGDSDERPVHDVQLNSFCIDLSEVTVAQYDACAKDGACAVAAKAVEWVGIQPHDHAVWDGFCNEGKADRATHPINCVAWDQARAFCKHEDKRLPSEAEWELAARGSEGRTFPWGSDRPSATLLNACGTECSSKAKLLDIELSALYPADDGYVSTAPVRSFPAGRTPNGVFDLGGNVSEWTAGSYCPYPGSNCMGELRATRGSAWTSDEMRKTRATARTKTAPTARTADVGFRCAK